MLPAITTQSCPHGARETDVEVLSCISPSLLPLTMDAPKLHQAF